MNKHKHACYICEIRNFYAWENELIVLNVMYMNGPMFIGV